MNPKEKVPGGFVHYHPPKPAESTEDLPPLKTSDSAMEELIQTEEQKKRRPDDNSASFWS